MSARYYLRCLGRPELQNSGGHSIRFRSRKHLGLLVYLAVEPRVPHRRERLAELLWPHAPGGEGRHSLATALTVIRSRLARNAFDSGRDYVRFVYPALDLDLDRLAAGDVLGNEFVPELEVAGFLDGFEIGDATEFMHWRDQQQARWLPAVCDALVRLMDRCRRNGDSRQIEALADRMLALEELSEEAIRAKMEARAFAGDRLTALKIFESWKAKLAEELGATPSELVEGMAIRLRRRGWERTTTNDIPNVPTDQWRDRGFIGRKAEYRALYESWEQTRGGNARHGLILGDSGVGKSTLVERMVTAAGLEGAVSSRFQCHEVEREIPYAAIASLVQGLLDRPGASGTPPEWLAELARTVPEVRQRFPSIPPAIETQGETARIRLTEAVYQLLLALADEHPVILVIDDMHLADDASIAVLHLLIRKIEQNRIMVVFTVRPGELEPTSQGARLRDNHARLRLAQLELPPMMEDESRQLLASLVPSHEPQPSVTARRAIIRAAAGYPMVLELLVKDWKMNGEACLALSLDAMTEDLSTSGSPVEAYRQIVGRMAQQLDPTTRNVLNLAAILGTRLSDISMYGLVDLSIGQTMTGFARLTDLRLLRDGARGLEFTNELIRAQAYLGVPSPLRKALHSKIADHLIARDSSDAHGAGLEIAWHCMRAGRCDEATPHLLRGGRQAILRGALQEAARGLQSALGHLKGDEAARASLMLAEILQDQGMFLDSIQVLSVSEPYSRPGDSEFAQILRLNAQRRLSDDPLCGSKQHVDTLKAIMSNSGTAACRVRAAQTTALWLNDLQDKHLARELLKAVQGLDQMELSDRERMEWALTKSMLLYHCRDVSSSLRQLHEAKAMSTSHGASSAARRIQTGFGTLEASEGNYLIALEHYCKAHDMCLQLGDDATIQSETTNIAMCFYRLGDYRSQLLWSERALDLVGERADIMRFKALFHNAWARAMLGETQVPLDLIALEDRRLPTTASSWLRQAWRLMAADVFECLGHHSEALEFATRAIRGEASSLQATAYAGPYARWLVLASEEKRDARLQLNGILRCLDEFDSVDKLEILAASIWLDSRYARIDRSQLDHARRLLVHLPRGVADSLERLGMLRCLHQA